jgi:hypothetical protein
MCDVDQRRDGICTFSFPASCVHCRLHPRACPSPDSYESACLDSFPSPPCASQTPRYAVRAGATARGSQRVVRAGRLRFVLRCRPSSDAPEQPPHLDPLTDDWVFEAAGVTTDCDPTLADAAGMILGTSHPLRLVQNGSGLSGCIDRFFEYHDGGSTSGESFVLETGPCCSITVGDGLADFSHHLEGHGPLDGPTLAALARWDFRHYPAPASGCTWTLDGTMTRLSAACSGDDECVAAEACARCVSGRCRPLPACRYDPLR